jgi:hypothetical protein
MDWGIYSYASSEIYTSDTPGDHPPYTTTLTSNFTREKMSFGLITRTIMDFPAEVEKVLGPPGGWPCG